MIGIPRAKLRALAVLPREGRRASTQNIHHPFRKSEKMPPIFEEAERVTCKADDMSSGISLESNAGKKVLILHG